MVFIDQLIVIVVVSWDARIGGLLLRIIELIGLFDISVTAGNYKCVFLICLLLFFLALSHRILKHF